MSDDTETAFVEFNEGGRDRQAEARELLAALSRLPPHRACDCCEGAGWVDGGGWGDDEGCPCCGGTGEGW